MFLFRGRFPANLLRRCSAGSDSVTEKYVNESLTVPPTRVKASCDTPKRCSRSCVLAALQVAPSGRVRYDGLMAPRDFKVFLEPDEDYGGYVVVCPSIPGCYSQGKTVPEALANIREAIDLCIEDMESRGEPIPDPNNVLIGSVLITR